MNWLKRAWNRVTAPDRTRPRSAWFFPMTDAGVRFVRRAHPRGVDYFLVNRGGAPVDGWVKLGLAARSAVLLDPRSPGRSGVAALRRGAASEVYLQLDPGESAVLQTFASEVVPGDRWPYANAVGDAEPVAGPWSLAFVEGGPVLPAPSELPALASWTTLADADTATTLAGAVQQQLAVLTTRLEQNLRGARVVKPRLLRRRDARAATRGSGTGHSQQSVTDPRRRAVRES